jgi:Sel1 repeat
MYHEGQGVTQNDPEANAWFRKAATQGQGIAAYWLGESLRLGRGITRNENEAMQWYQQSATTGYAPAQARLGAGYLTGSGAAQDYHQAARWLTAAARQDDPWAQLLLGGMYADGTGVDQNLGEARALYAQAAAGPVPEAAERARESAAALPRSSERAPADHPGHSSTTQAVIGLAAVAIGAAVVFSLLSRNSSEDAAAVAPINGTSSLAGPFGTQTSPPAPPVTAFPGPPPPKAMVGDITRPLTPDEARNPPAVAR